GQLGQGQAEAAEELGHRGPEQAGLAQRLDGLAREARVPVDRRGVWSGVLDADRARRGQRQLEDRAGHGLAPSSASAARMAAMLSNTARLSMRSGNSTSKRPSSASMTFTLACELMPAAYRSASSASLLASTLSLAWSLTILRISSVI